MPAPSPVLRPLVSHPLPRMLQSTVARMPSPLLFRTVQFWTLDPFVTEMPIPLVGVAPVESVSVTVQPVMVQPNDAVMPAEVAAVLKLFRAEQFATVLPEPTEMPNTPWFPSAAQLVIFAPNPVVIPLPRFPWTVHPCRTQPLPVEMPTPVVAPGVPFVVRFPLAVQPVSVQASAVVIPAETLAALVLARAEQLMS